MTLQTIPKTVANTVELIQQRHPGEDGLEQVLDGLIKAIAVMRAERLEEGRQRRLAQLKVPQDAD